MTERELIGAGFKQGSMPKILYPTATAFYQRRIKKASETLYFVNVFQYQTGRYEAEVTYNNGCPFHRSHPISITLYGLPKDFTASEVLDECQQIWERLQPWPYDSDM